VKDKCFLPIFASHLKILRTMEYKTFVVTYRSGLGKYLTENVTGRTRLEALNNFKKKFGIQNEVIIKEKNKDN
jgi:hypothetical protein